MPKKPPSKNQLPPLLHNLTLKELFLFTGISLYLIEGFVQGKFKPLKEDREKMTILSRRFYAWNDSEKTAFLQRTKWRKVRQFISFDEREELFTDPIKYSQRLDKLIDRYWDRIIIATTERANEIASKRQ